MGACASKPEGCVKGRIKLPKKRRHCRRRRRVSKRHVSFKDNLQFENNIDRSHFNPTFQIQGSLDVAWFDSSSIIDSERDDEFYSVRDDAFSLNGSESTVSMSSRKDLNLPREARPQLNLDGSSNEGSGGGGGGANACLPRPASTGTGPAGSRRKLISKLSFKLREAQADLAVVSPKALRQKPMAGTSIPYCPVEKRIPDCWSPIEPSAFKVRGKNYLRDKKKEFAPNCAAYYPLGADLFLSQRKVDHIARFFELPHIISAGELPSILVVNVQIPLYPTTIFQSENDGEGMSLVLYFKLSESYSKELPSHFRENLTRLINDEVERVRGFPVDTIASFRERLKILGRVANVEDLHLSAAEKKLMNAYNEKPVLTRPQHEFYLGENYFEIDLDMHRFSYIARKGFEAFHDRLQSCILDFGLTIQGNKAEDLPEHMLCCIRLNEINFTKYKQLGF
ncbi:uncharacterized protein LOC126715047 [Quercus robur]|uniref:uncharacterized protein LOC126715047 n=1 Tax=Quercus robur TaxID=38942 RepID=UPI002163090D|nr:uncharacterized protein LOC126715047 [Quercus robur]